MPAQISTLTSATTGQKKRNDTTFRIAGGRTGVLLIHGLCGTPAEMRFIANGLARAGYTVHCPTLAGHGGSRADVVASTRYDWYRSAKDALDELRRECDTVIVGGLCLGSIIAMHLAANNPAKVQGIALFSPTFWTNGWAMPWYSKLFSLVPTRWVANLMQFPDAASLGIKCPRVREFVRAALAACDGSNLGTSGVPGAMVFEHRRLVASAKKMLGRIRQPTLIIHSREDDYANLDNATYIQAKLPSAADLVVLDDSYHMVTLDKQRHVVAERMRAFVERIAASANNGVAEMGETSRPGEAA
jgi:carboxylesterase